MKGIDFKKDIILNLYDRQLLLQKFADYKNYIILIILGFISWKIVKLFSEINELLQNSHISIVLNVFIVILLFMLIVSFFISFVYTMKSIFPNINGESNTPIFWGNVKNYELDSIVDFFMKNNEEILIKELIKEYKINSEITLFKFKNNKLGMIFMLISVILFLVINFILAIK